VSVEAVYVMEIQVLLVMITVVCHTFRIIYSFLSD